MSKRNRKRNTKLDDSQENLSRLQQDNLLGFISLLEKIDRREKENNYQSKISNENNGKR